MTDAARESLRGVLLRGYDDFKLRLARRLGSADQASDALQDAWVHLGNVKSEHVARPRPYIFRMAYNIALARRRSERDTVTLELVRDELSLVQDAPSPAEVAQAREELRLLVEAARELTPRRRDILFSARLNEESLNSIGRRLGISERAVARELRTALLYCAARLDRRSLQRRGPRGAGGYINENDT